MIKKCIVCGLVPDNAERYYKVQAMLSYRDGDRPGVSCVICRKHLSEEIACALGLTNPSFVDAEYQSHMEERWFRG